MQLSIAKSAYIGMNELRDRFRHSVPVIAIASAVLGFVSLLKLGVDSVRSLYETIAMFAVASDLSLGHMHTEEQWAQALWTARIVSPLLTFTAAVDVVFEMLRDRRKVPWWWQLTGHWIIVGAGRTGRVLAEQLDKSPHFPRIAVIEADPEAEAVKMLRDQGIVVITGDGRDAEALEQAGVKHASGIIAATALDWVNVTSCLAAYENSGPRDDFRMVAHVGDGTRKLELEKGATGALGQLQMFSAYTEVAHRLVAECPGDKGAIYIIAGLGRLGIAVLQALHVRDADKRQQPHESGVSEGSIGSIITIDNGISGDVAHRGCPAALRQFHTHFQDDIDSPLLGEALRGEVSKGPVNAPIRAFICTDNDDCNMDFAIKLRKTMRPGDSGTGQEISVVTRLFTWPKGAADASAQVLAGVKPKSYSDLLEACIGEPQTDTGWQAEWRRPRPAQKKV